MIKQRAEAFESQKFDRRSKRVFMILKIDNVLQNEVPVAGMNDHRPGNDMLKAFFLFWRKGKFISSKASICHLTPPTLLHPVPSVVVQFPTN